MKKGFGFGKLLKQLFFMLLISCFTLLVGSSVKAEWKIQEIGIGQTVNPYDNSFEVGFLKGGALLSTKLGTSKGLLPVQQQVIYWWYPNGKLYFYSNDRFGQGFFKAYSVCDSFTGSSPANCVFHEGELDSDELINFFSTVQNGDYVGYNWYDWHNNMGQWGKSVSLCWSSSQLGKSLCFTPSQDCNYNTERCGANLTGSLGFTNLNFSNIPYSAIGSAPGTVNYNPGTGNVGESSSIGENASLTGNIVYNVCTNLSAYEYYKSQGYTDNLCYAGISDFYYSGLVVNVPGQGITYKSLYNYTSGNYNNFVSWLDYWRSVYDQRYVLASNPFNDYTPALYYYIENVNKFGNTFDSASIYDYCTVYLDSNLDGAYLGPLYNSFACNSEGNVVPIGGVNSNSNNPGISQSDWSGIGDMGGGSDNTGTTTTFNGKTFMNNFFNLVKSSVVMPNKGDFGLGYLPSYIILFMLALIFFRLISH